MRLILNKKVNKFFLLNKTESNESIIRTAFVSEIFMIEKMESNVELFIRSVFLFRQN